MLHASSLATRVQPESDKEQRDLLQQQHGRRQRDKEHRAKDEERKRQRHHYDFDKFMRRKDETKWGKGYCQDRAKKEGHHHGFSYCPDGGDKLGKEDREDPASRKERLRNKVSEKVSMSWRGGGAYFNVLFLLFFYLLISFRVNTRRRPCNPLFPLLFTDIFLSI